MAVSDTISTTVPRTREITPQTVIAGWSASSWRRPPTIWSVTRCTSRTYASVLAELRAEEVKRHTQTRIAWFSLAVSSLAVVISFFALVFR